MIEVRTKVAEKGNPDEVELRIATEKTLWIDRVADLISDWLSPILVKETRQALKSRQFFWTFFLLLIAIAIWTMIGMTAYDPNLDYGLAGPGLLVGYWVILGFPLSIVIPFGAYRSLAREYEDGTIQLISVTTMKAWQIVIGKLGSSMLQMLVYFSVLAPCIAFTYLLKGISIPQMLLGLSVCATGCLTLCSLALFLAGATRSRLYGVAASIFLILIQFATYVFWCIFAQGVAFGELEELARSQGSFISVGLLLALLTTAMLFLAIAASLISFESDNRSTLARVMLLVQQTTFIGFCISAVCFQLFAELPVILICIVAHYWVVAGWFMIGERDEMSRRVRRNVPKSILNRSLFSFLLPGSGRGLIFAMMNIWICAGIFIFLFIVASKWFPEPASVARMGWSRMAWPMSANLRISMGVGSVCLYSSFFLSMTFLICHLLRKKSIQTVVPMTSFMLGLVTFLLFIGMAMFLHFNFINPYQTDSYSNYQIFNPYWTTMELTENEFANVHVGWIAFAGLAMAFTSGIAVVIAANELLQTATAIPDRVQQEIAESQSVEQLEVGESIEDILAVNDDAG